MNENNETKHEDHKTEAEIKAFITETKAMMDAGPEAGISFEAGLERICKFIEPLSAESFLRWIQVLVDVYKTDEGTPPGKEKLHKINVGLNKMPVFCDAISRFHDWKNRLPTPENASAVAQRLIDRISGCPSVDELERIIRDARTQREKFESVSAAGAAFRQVIDQQPASAMESRGKGAYFAAFKKHVMGEEGLPIRLYSALLEETGGSAPESE